MNIIVMWLSTIIVSFFMDFISESQFIKNMALNGYKLKLKKMTEFNNTIKDMDAVKSVKLMRYVPFINILNSLKKSADFINKFEQVITQFKVLDIIEEMTDEEKKDYESKPSFLNAMRLAVKSMNGKRNIDVLFKKTSELSDDEVIIDISLGQKLTEEEATIVIDKYLRTINATVTNEEKKQELIQLSIELKELLISDSSKEDNKKYEPFEEQQNIKKLKR